MVIHLSNVLTDHFSNSISEKTTKGILMKFSQCPFKNIFHWLPLSNRGIYIQFLRFTARASRALTILHFKLDILHNSQPSHQKNRKYCAICSHVMQYTDLNNGYLNSFNRKRQFRVSVVNRLFESFSKAYYLL